MKRAFLILAAFVCATGPGFAQPGNSLLSKFSVDFYGYVRASAAYDTEQVDPGFFARWVESTDGRKKDDQFNMSAKATRFGFNVVAPETAGVVAKAKIEADFAGDVNAPENKSHIRMRHAYVEIDWKKYELSLLAGQTWDIISPLLPTTVNFSPQWWAGNIGYRRAQIRVTKKASLSDSVKAIIQAGITRTIGDASGFAPDDSGEDSGIPTFAGRAAVSMPILTEKATTIGVSSHWGEDELDTAADGSDDHYHSWSVNLDFTVPLCKFATLKGEGFVGQNLDEYLGGIAQGINTTQGSEVQGVGGWVAFNLGPFDRWRFNIGAGVDEPNNSDLNAGQRTQNTNVYINALYALTTAVTLGGEIGQWDTDYKGTHGAHATRLQFMVLMKF